MPRTTSDTDLDEILECVRKSLRKLTKTVEGTRRRARTRVLAQLRALRAKVDEKYPAIIKKAKFTRLKTFEGRTNRLTRTGWRQIDAGEAVAAYAAAGVPVRRVRGTPRKEKYEHIAYFVPGWAMAIGHQKPNELRAAKKSLALKRAALTVEALTDAESA